MNIGLKLFLLANIAIGCLLSASATPHQAPIDYTQDVLPILASKCFTCHGPDPAKRKAGLRLDDGEGLFAVLPSGNRAVVRGDLAASALALRITHPDPGEMMPPADAPKPLNPAEIEMLSRWVAEGAPWEGHWAFQPLRAHEPPPVQRTDWVRNAIDAHILAAQETRGLSPAPEADRRTLIRRLYFDLLGLPPAPEAVEAFVGDARPDAYERLVDELLASPRHGERWARHWLDVAHYGDTHGYDKDKRRPHAWPYRDYVIAAFNNDKPYGRFVEEQLAGDALYPEDPQATVATGFIAAGPWDFVGHVELREGTVDKAITRNLDRDDMVSTSMGAFTSLTVGCARCHDHKFDPISQADYYSLQANFAGVERANRPYDLDPAVHLERQRLLKEQERLQTVQRTLEAKMEAIATPERTDLEAVLTEAREAVEQLDGKESPSNGYHSAIENLPNVTKWVQVDLGTVQRLEKIRLLHARPTDFPDTPGFGFPVRFKIEVSETEDFAAPVVLADYTETDSSARTDAPFELDAAGASGRYLRVTATRLWKRLEDYVFALAELEAYAGGKNVARDAVVSAKDSIDSGRWHTAFLVDGFDSRNRVGAATTNDAATQTALAAAVKALGESKASLKAYLRGALTPEEQSTFSITEATLTGNGLELRTLSPALMVYAGAAAFTSEGNFSPAEAPRDVFLLKRGDIKQPADPALPGTVGCLPDLPSRFDLPTGHEEGARRAALARWITDPANVLTWRSIVNRVWHYHFGQGIVETPNDFGRMGAPPTHPELLDYLALAFLEHGQSLKWLHREIVCSAAYRQQSLHNDAFAQLDGGNRYLWRMNRRQLDAEALRDSVLSVSGSLDLSMGGPGVDLFAFKDDHSPRYLYEQLDPADRTAYRRSIYRFVVRSAPDPFMATLDCADPSQSVPVRTQTLTALQVLATLNNSMMVYQAALFADLLARDGAPLEVQIDTAYERAFARTAATGERELLSQYATQYGMAAACRLLLNSNEFIFVD
ncbi:MAG: DUF1553 domain-containing protein [Candidatus Hydrogenedentes bacterium]|nr:DUF1553 domain-containing protein [Candidatus Hydrogenedentota bacterium]